MCDALLFFDNPSDRHTQNAERFEYGFESLPKSASSSLVSGVADSADAAKRQSDSHTGHPHPPNNKEHRQSGALLL
jgi:hypothetical protein